MRRVKENMQDLISKHTVQKRNNANNQIINSFIKYTESNPRQIFFIQIPVLELMKYNGGVTSLK